MPNVFELRASASEGGVGAGAEEDARAAGLRPWKEGRPFPEPRHQASASGLHMLENICWISEQRGQWAVGPMSLEFRSECGWGDMPRTHST